MSRGSVTVEMVEISAVIGTVSIVVVVKVYDPSQRPSTQQTFLFIFYSVLPIFMNSCLNKIGKIRVVSFATSPLNRKML